MKRNFNLSLNLVIALLMLNITMLLTTSCEEKSSDKNPTVRLYNATNANFFTKYGGFKYGDAEFIGKLESMSTTSYKELKPGEYPIELQNISGEWVEASDDLLGPVESNSIYTISITSNITIVTDSTGNVSPTGNDDVVYTFSLEQD
jgi:hypothetical protein